MKMVITGDALNFSASTKINLISGCVIYMYWIGMVAQNKKNSIFDSNAMKVVEPKAGHFDLTDFAIIPKSCVFC